MLSRLAHRYKTYLAKKEYRISLLYSVLAFIGAYVINTYAIAFATEHAGGGVPDLILSNIPTFDVDALFVYGTFVVVAVTAIIVLWHPKRTPFALYALALFLLIRSGFTSLTHIGPFGPIPNDFGATITHSFFGADFFFSGHTGMPFLGALAFWRERHIRYFYLAASVSFAVIVLLGHLHYSIDVFAAFFITYTIFDLAKWLFPKEWETFQSDL